MHFLKHPVYLSSFVILSETPFCADSLQRALYGRLGVVNLVEPYHRQKLTIFTVALKFMNKEGKVPCPSSIAWWRGNVFVFFLSIIFLLTVTSIYREVVVNGRKQGVTKKDQTNGRNLLKICKFELFKSFTKLKHKLNDCNDNYTYREAKLLSKDYQANWEIVKGSLGVWTRKNPDLLNFK